MALRFVLVSAVASLGLTLPKEGEVGAWTASAQKWMNARLAEWDARCAEDEGISVLAARAKLSELGESGRGDAAFEVVMEEMVRSFSAESNAAPGQEVREVPPPAPTFEPMVVGEELYTGTAFALNRASEGLVLDLAVKANERGEREFEPMVVGDDLYKGVAYSLNRASEGIALVSEGASSQVTARRVPEDAGASRVSQFSVAIRLTREAVYAWSNLLHGPAVVAISR